MGKVHNGIPGNLAKKLRDKYGLRQFIETGTFHGRTTEWASPNFDAVKTVEYDRDLFLKTSARLVVLGNIVFYVGDSAQVLPKMLRRVYEPAMIWLDAHWSRDLGYNRPSFGECPVLLEINAIVTHGMNHVVLIDDAQYFVNPPPKPHRANQWPTYEQIVDAFGPEWYVRHEENHDIIIALKRGTND